MTTSISGAGPTYWIGQGSFLPFSNVTIGDNTLHGMDTLTITPSSYAGTLTGDGLVANRDGTYTIMGPAQTITSELGKLSFRTSPGVPDTSTQVTFILQDVANGSSATDRNTVVTIVYPYTNAIIAGTHSTTTTAEAAVLPFAGVTISDPNQNGALNDYVTITLGGAKGTLSGNGLSQNADGSYSLAAAPASTLTAELNALIFQPGSGAPGVPQSTTFSLHDQTTPGEGLTDYATTVIDTPAAGTTTPDTNTVSTIPTEETIDALANIAFGMHATYLHPLIQYATDRLVTLLQRDNVALGSGATFDDVASDAMAQVTNYPGYGLAATLLQGIVSGHDGGAVGDLVGNLAAAQNPQVFTATAGYHIGHTLSQSGL